MRASRRWYAPSRRFSRTVREPRMPRPSGTRTTPRRTTSSTASPPSEAPANVIEPRAGRTTPMIAFISVLLPAQFEPTRATISPSATERLTPSSARTTP
jgi:hypothetical protein